MLVNEGFNQLCMRGIVLTEHSYGTQNLCFILAL